MLTTAHFKHIDAKDFGAEGIYKANWAEYSATIQVTRRPSNVGGSRLWLKCSCGKKVKRLYLCRKWLRCRHCLGLKYQSQAVDAYTRAQWREEKYSNMLIDGESRPKGMHKRTYWKIQTKVIEAREEQNIYLLARFARVMSKKL